MDTMGVEVSNEALRGPGEPQKILALFLSPTRLFSDLRVGPLNLLYQGFSVAAL